MSPSPSSAPIDEAAEWLATLSDPACSAEERKAFAHWLTRSNVNVEEFLAISTLTRRLQTSTAWPEIDLDKLLAEARSDDGKLVQFPQARPTRAGAGSVSRWSLAAAIVLAVIAAAIMLSSGNRWNGSTYATGLGELRSVTLEDGSIVQLDAQSAIRAHYSERERAIELVSGTAIFTVAKRPGRPFRVSTGFADIVALGTSFNVSSRAHRTVVTVIEGRVSVRETAAPGRLSEAVKPTGDGRYEKSSAPVPLELAAGEQAVVEAHKPLAKARNADSSKITAWTSRRLYFDETPLAEAIQDFSRYSAQTIRIEDAALAEKRITGIFDASDPAALVAFLGRYADTAIESTPQGWVISPAR